MSAHTPGPWKIIAHPRVAHVDSVTSVGSGSNGMASIAWMTGGRLFQEANARLIAAAPELLAALRGLLSHHDSVGEEADDVDVKRAVAAIAKAEGR